MLENFKALDEAEITEVSGGKYSGAAFVYVVKSGDNLSTLASKYGTTVSTIVELNKISNPNLINVGQKILIPYKG